MSDNTKNLPRPKAILIANPKGGSGKTTLATNLAGYFASRDYAVMLGDTDRQQSAAQWLAMRPDTATSIRGWQVSRKGPARPPMGTTHAVLDTAAGLRGRRLTAMLKQMNRVLVPIQPSVFDRLAAGVFLDALAEEKAVRKGRAFCAVVGMRVDPRTRLAHELEHFLAGYDIPVLAYLRDTQRYPQAAEQGLTLFDLPPAQDIEQWQSIIGWVEAV